MKTIRPWNERDLELFQWGVFEPLRRNKTYQREYLEFVSTPLDDPLLELKRKIDFCRKWDTPCLFDPSCDWFAFRGPLGGETESEAVRRIQGNILSVYAPLADRAATVLPFDGFIVEEKYIRLAIDLGKSRNQIESDAKEELDFWQRDEWTKVRQGKRLRAVPSDDILRVSVQESSMLLTVNLEAPRRSIDRKIADVLSTELKKWRRKNRGSDYRLHCAKWEARFAVYDAVWNDKKCFRDISKASRRPIKTVRRQYKQARSAIHRKKYPKKIRKSFHTPQKNPKEFPSAETLISICDRCTKKTCEKTGLPCKDLETLLKSQPKDLKEEIPTDYVQILQIFHDTPNKGRKLMPRAN